MNPEQFKQALQKYHIELSEEQMEQFSIYYQMLVEWNEKINLTAITEEKEVYLKHFYDSISAAFYYDLTSPKHICDVGAGAGFPSIPLKICFPHLEITIVDSLQKRIKFLNELATALKLKDVHFHHSRAEDFGRNKEFREKFDIVIARAVARMSVLSELCLPLCKVTGSFIALKGAQSIEELGDSKAAIHILGGEVVGNESFTLPMEDSERSIVIIDKVKQTPKKYPRKPGMPNRNPIQ